MQCLALLGNGDVLTGDSGGVLLIWSNSTVEPTPGKGPKGVYQISKQIKAHDGSVHTLSDEKWDVVNWRREGQKSNSVGP